ncbi:MAG: fatty acid CoA ligase family protein, partial [Gemmataceae bacterium]
MTGQFVNIAQPLVDQAHTQPDGAAFLHRTAGTITYRQLNAESDRLARGLRSLGLRPGMRIVLMVPPSVEFFSLTFALFKLGCVIVLIDPGMGARNLGICLGEAMPDGFIGVPRAHLARLLLGWGKKTLRHFVTVGRTLFWVGWSLGRVQQAGAEGEPVMASTRADDMAAILFTSGSTGVAKGAVYTHGIFAAQVEMLRTMYGIEPGEVDLPTFPLFGLFGPALGMTAILPQMNYTRPGSVHPRAILDPIREQGVTSLFGSPALLRQVAFSPQAQGVKLTSLRRVISAGAPVAPAVIRRVVELLPPGCQVHTPYGATEALPVSTIGSQEILGETGALTSQGKGVCVGVPVASMTVRIIRISDEPIPTWSADLVEPAGQIGEIVVAGPVVTRSYFNRPESTALHKIAQGDTLWHRMGDVGYLDARGRIWFCGRKSHRVRSRTTTYFTIPVEGVFNAHPAVARTALVGVDRGAGIEPELCVEVLKGHRIVPGQLVHELAQLGAGHEHTRAIRRFHLHAGFPVDIRHNAKIFREKLATWAARQ